MFILLHLVVMLWASEEPVVYLPPSLCRSSSWIARAFHLFSLLSYSWIPLAVLLNCNRIKSLGATVESIKAAIPSSTLLVLNPEGDKLKRVTPYVPPSADR